MTERVLNFKAGLGPQAGSGCGTGSGEYTYEGFSISQAALRALQDHQATWSRACDLHESEAQAASRLGEQSKHGTNRGR